jgi:hypothetical protein
MFHLAEYRNSVTWKWGFANNIAGFALTNITYEQAISLLYERYGQKDRSIQTYMKALLEVPAPMYTVQSVRKFYDTTETYIRH